MERVVFADFVVKGVVRRTNYFETAAWYQNVRLNEGNWPIEGNLKDNGQIEDLVFYRVPSVITEDNFQSLFCGNPIGKPYDTLQNMGKVVDFRGSFYCHALAHSLLENESSSFVLREGFEARPIDFEYLGKPCRTYGIFKRS